MCTDDIKPTLRSCRGDRSVSENVFAARDNQIWPIFAQPMQMTSKKSGAFWNLFFALAKRAPCLAISTERRRLRTGLRLQNE